MELSKEVLEKTKNLKTPFVVFDKEIIKKNFNSIKNSIPGLKVFYAVKANPHLEVLKTINKLGGGFEVASVGELNNLKKLNVKDHKIISSNPIKTPGFIKESYNYGVRHYVFDSELEAKKISKYAPKSEVHIRIIVDNKGSDWPLSFKFGIDYRKAVKLLKLAKELGLKPKGVTFHVGSQCLNERNWANALKRVSSVFRSAAKRGIKLDSINLGGGLPIKHTKKTPSIDDIALRIKKALKKNVFKNVKLYMEPGRAIIGDAAILGASVIGKAKRPNKKWLYLDIGVFNGLMETIEGFQYELKTIEKGPLKEFTVAGPSCDSVDKMFDHVLLPDLNIGDRVYIMNAGAYTLSYASHFDGFSPPEVYFL